MSSEPNTPAGVTTGGAVEPLLKKRAPTLYAIIWFKLLKGLLCLMLTVIIYNEADKNRNEDYQKFMQGKRVAWVFYHLGVHPENKFFTHLAEGISNLTDARVHRAALAALLLSLFPLTEGIGMYFRVGWAGWLAIGESAFFIPIEFYELVNPKTFSWFIVDVTAINIIIVCYLFSNREELFHHHRSRSRLKT